MRSQQSPERRTSVGIRCCLVAAAALVGAVAAAGPAVGAKSRGGIAYTESNDPVSNRVLAFRYTKTGAITPVKVAGFSTGGRGSRQVAGRSAALFDADQRVIINGAHTLLFAVNSGSNTIAVFRIVSPGVLKPVKGSPFNSFGETPASLGLSGNTLVVVNKAQSADQPITGPPNYTSFHVDTNGRLEHLASTITAGQGASPTDAAVSPNGKLVFGTDFTPPGGVKLRAFRLSHAGNLSNAPGSPKDPDPAAYQGGMPPRPVPPSQFPMPLGTGVHPKRNFVFFDFPTASRIASYSFDANGRLHFVKGFDSGPGTFTPCWNLITPNGRYMYVTDSGTSNLSVFNVSNPANPRLLQVTPPVIGGGPPADMALDPTGRFLFTVVATVDGDSPIGQPSTTGNQLHVFRIGAGGHLTEIGPAPAALPISPADHVVGLAVQAR